MFSSKILALLVFFQIFSLPTHADSSSDELSRRNKIVDLARAGDVAQAEKLLRDHLNEVMRTKQTSTWDLKTLELLLILQFRPADAARIYDFHSQIEPTPLVKYHLGQMLFADNRPKEAIEYLKLSDVPKPIQSMRLTSLGMAYQQLDDIKNAISSYDQVWEQFPFRQSSYESRAWSNLLKAEPGVAKLKHDYFPFATSTVTVKWPLSKMPLKVFIEEDKTGPPAEYRTKYNAALRQACDDWSTASQGKIKFTFVDSKQDANIVCHWLESIGMGANVGHGEPEFNPGGIVHAEVQLQTIIGKIPTLPEVMHRLCVHEVGHALGLMHSPDPNDIMCTGSQGPKISERDKNTLNALYNDDVKVQVISKAYLKNEPDFQIRTIGECAVLLLSTPDAALILKTAQSGIDAAPNSAAAANLWNIVGFIHLKKGAYPDAENSFKKALDNRNLIPTERKKAMNNYAAILHLQHRDDEALAAKKQALSIKDE